MLVLRLNASLTLILHSSIIYQTTLATMPQGIQKEDFENFNNRLRIKFKCNNVTNSFLTGKKKNASTRRPEFF
tara:strand:+ start:2143 stop:2361 length:219 start_codon:yes stop_codon:yes gene_type:complete